MAIDAAPVTAEQLRRLPDDGFRRELVRGELRLMAPAGCEHGRVALLAGAALLAHARDSGCGVAFAAETGFVLATDPDTIRAPDAAFVSSARAEAQGITPGYWPGAPDLAVEVVSPGDSFHEVQEKALEWLAAGAVAVLVLDPPQRTATVYRVGGEVHVHEPADTIDLGEAVPGFTPTVAELFA